MFAKRNLRTLLVAAFAAGAGIPAHAQSTAPTSASPAATSAPSGGNLAIELNKASDANGNCRLVFVAKNDTGQPLDQTAYEVVIFDGEGGVLDFLVLQFGRYPSGKTRVVRFDVENQQCEGISRLLVNDIDVCVSGGQATNVCVEKLTTTSRNDIKFDQ